MAISYYGILLIISNTAKIDLEDKVSIQNVKNDPENLGRPKFRNCFETFHPQKEFSFLEISHKKNFASSLTFQ